MSRTTPLKKHRCPENDSCAGKAGVGPMDTWSGRVCCLKEFYDSSSYYCGTGYGTDDASDQMTCCEIHTGGKCGDKVLEQLRNGLWDGGG